jgi:hypothetical protein
MVTHYPTPIVSNGGLRSAADAHQAEDGLGMRALLWLRQTFCGLRGHDHLMQFEKERMFLQCVSCGHESPGWELTETPPAPRAHRDSRRPHVMRPHLVSERRIA